MIDAYLDESGIHDGAEVCLIAGYFGGRGQWRKFGKAWEQVLGDFDVPLNEFHAQNLVKRTNFFHGWNTTQSYELQLALAQTIARFRIHPVAHGVLVKDFFKLSLAERRFLTGATLTAEGQLEETGKPKQPYFAVFQPVVKRVLSHAEVGGKAHFFLGPDRQFANYATGLYLRLKNNPLFPHRERFGDVGFPLAKETPGLQAADLLVHILYLDTQNRVQTRLMHTLGTPPELIRILIANVRHKEDLVYQDEKLIRETLKLIPVEQRGELLKEDLAS
jgi:hypothetical protein